MNADDTLSVKVAEEIRVALVRRRISARQLAAKVGLSQSAMWAAVRGLPPGLIAGGRIPHTITERCRREYLRLGLPEWVTAHKLRHFFGTWCHAAAGDLRVTQELMGHSSPAVTQVYTAVSDTRMRAAVLGLPTLNNLEGTTR